VQAVLSYLHSPLHHLPLCPARWYVPPSAGPGPNGASTQFWVYRSAVDATRDTQAGLAGPLVIGRPGSLNQEGKPSDVDKEIYLMLQVGGAMAIWHHTR